MVNSNQNHTKNSLCSIDPDLLNLLLDGYEPSLRRFVYLMLTNGILLHAKDVSSQLQGIEHNNHASAIRNSSVTDMKIQKEMDKGHLGGPFDSPPFDNFIISPIGLVPKKEPNSFRLIHDLSFPDKNGLNSCTPREFTAVHYENIDLLLQLVLKFGKGCLISKADLEGAFRILPMSPSQYHLVRF